MIIERLSALRVCGGVDCHCRSYPPPYVFKFIPGRVAKRAWRDGASVLITREVLVDILYRVVLLKGDWVVARGPVH